MFWWRVPNAFLERVGDSSVGRFCDCNHEQHHFQSVVIPEQDHFCQWISHDDFATTSSDPLLLGAIQDCSGRRPRNKSRTSSSLTTTAFSPTSRNRRSHRARGNKP